MRLLFIRHGDPDYIHDTLTEKGKREAELLSRLTLSLHVGDVYVSPCGRARMTADIGLSTVAVRQKEIVPWLMEFMTDLDLNRHPEFRCAYGEDTPLMAEQYRPDMFEHYLSFGKMLFPDDLKAFLPDEHGQLPYYAPRIIWDILPAYLSRHPELYDPVDWRNAALARAAHIPECADYVFTQFDDVLAMHGYRRHGLLYDAERSNKDTVTFFCHLGMTCLLMSHLMHVSPFVLWTYLVFAPSSVTEFVTEEREKGIAIFRGKELGSITHLVMGKEEPSFQARFCETYDSPERH